MRAPWRFVALAVAAAAAQTAAAADLVAAWRAAELADRDYAVARANQAAAEPRRDQAAALWRPNVALTASVGLAGSDTAARGAQFSLPGTAPTGGVGFDTSVDNGRSGRWALSAVQPLYNPQRRAEQRQLTLSVDAAELATRAARQALMLHTAERYFDLALAEEALRVLRLQQDVVQRAATEAQDRFRLGAVPVTDTHEAQARLAAVRAQVLAAESDLQLKRQLLADSTGLPEATLRARLPGAAPVDAAPRPLAAWIADALAGNLQLQAQVLATEQAREEAAKFSLRAAPTLDLVAQAARDRLSGNGDFGSASNTASNHMVGIQLAVPLFTGGYRSAKAEEALRLVDKAQRETERARQQVAQQVRADWLGLDVGAARVRALADGLVASGARRDATETGLQVGDRTTQDLLNAESDDAAARLALAQARVGLVLARLRLAALTGQLDEPLLAAVDARLDAGAAQ